MSTLSEELKQFAKSYHATGNGEVKCVKMMKAAAEEIEALEETTLFLRDKVMVAQGFTQGLLKQLEAKQ